MSCLTRLHPQGQVDVVTKEEFELRVARFGGRLTSKGS